VTGSEDEKLALELIVMCDRSHEAAVTSISFSPDGYLMFTGDAAGAVLMWGKDRAATSQAILYSALPPPLPPSPPPSLPPSLHLSHSLSLTRTLSLTLIRRDWVQGRLNTKRPRSSRGRGSRVRGRVVAHAR
jgi:hypothetical protein